ncbi:uncharacterized protein KY384_008752 [Bacidia gigantensis]|uniref:uncharacterized protein n=1 Tax=Bacidia gigantensis TaxID=2732470 RepID=UPI001D05A6C9|nr:uncharacterized protein KY384_008752 [Bacidia gigantensis]KAG8526551.1 hypothetical protein KY384_008752 [Bacidia gigantensis]
MAVIKRILAIVLAVAALFFSIEIGLSVRKRTELDKIAHHYGNFPKNYSPLSPSEYEDLASVGYNKEIVKKYELYSSVLEGELISLQYCLNDMEPGLRVALEEGKHEFADLNRQCQHVYSTLRTRKAAIFNLLKFLNLEAWDIKRLKLVKHNDKLSRLAKEEKWTETAWPSTNIDSSGKWIGEDAWEMWSFLSN